MRAYTGDTRSKALLAELEREGVGQLVVRGRLRKVPEGPWVYDNGVYEDFKAGATRWTPRANLEWLCDVLAMSKLSRARQPAWIVLPDEVGRWAGTCSLSSGALTELLELRLLDEGMKFAWVLQDGAERYGVRDVLNTIGLARERGLTTLFVGGSTEWKWKTAGEWGRLCRGEGLQLHIGRVGSAKLVDRAVEAEAHSIDSCTPLWSRENLRSWLGALRGAVKQLRMFSPAEPADGTTT